jgi:REP element-mobilizing transposase RayT
MNTVQTGSCALRRGRVSQRNSVYHITTATYGRQPFFSAIAIGRCVVRALRAAEREQAARTLAFVVMPDHLHWLFDLQHTSLSTVVGQMKGRAARHATRALGIAAYAGPIWQHGFFDHALRTEESLVAAARYIIGNPLRAGLVTRIGDYPLWDCVWVGAPVGAAVGAPSGAINLVENRG